jgi:hypothetical protein
MSARRASLQNEELDAAGEGEAPAGLRIYRKIVWREGSEYAGKADEEILCGGCTAKSLSGERAAARFEYDLMGQGIGEMMPRASCRSGRRCPV